MIMSAFANGDRDTLSSLVSKEVYQAFDAAIQAREAQNQTLAFTIFEEPKVAYFSAEQDRGQAYVGVQITSVQSNRLSDAEGNTIGGSDSTPETVENRWIFSRQLEANDPNWTLIQTAG